MEKKNNGKQYYLGGLAILATASVLCVKGMKKINARLKEKTEKKKETKQ